MCFHQPKYLQRSMYIYISTHSQVSHNWVKIMNCVMEMAGQTQNFLTILLLSLLVSFNTVSASSTRPPQTLFIEITTSVILSLSWQVPTFTGAAVMIHLGQDFPASQAAHQVDICNYIWLNHNWHVYIIRDGLKLMQFLQWQKNQPLQKLFNGRMDLQYGDYPVSGANPRHTPKPPPGRV